MVCDSCGKEIAEGSVFCSFCGATQTVQEQPPAEEKRMYCKKCNKEFEEEMLFCDECGMKLHPKDAANTYQRCYEISVASVFRGDKPSGSPIFNGSICLYDDRIETKTVLTSERKVLVKMDEIESATKGSQRFIWSSLVIQLKDGTALTVSCMAAGSDAIDRALQIIHRGISTADSENPKT